MRVVYLAPSDKAIRNDYKAAVAEAINHLQGFYKQELDNNYAFSLNSTVVEAYQTTHTASWYSTNQSRPNASQSSWFWENALADGFQLTGGGFNDPNNRWIFYIDADSACGQVIGGTSGVALLAANDFRGLIGEQNIPSCSNQSPDTGGKYRWIGGLGHELGHSFNLPHPPGCGGSGPNYGCAGGAFAANSLMWVGYAFYPNTYFLPEDKTALLNTGFFYPTNCVFSLGSTSQNFNFTGGSGNFTVNTGAGCAWTAASNASWITITSGASGSGSGTVSYSISANSGGERSGTITAGGQTFTITQASVCTFLVSQIGGSIPEISANGGNLGFSVTTQAGCQWVATSNASWITIASGSSGTGNGTVTLNFAPNSGASRSGSVTIAGQTLNFLQNGQPPCSYSLSPSSFSISAGGGNSGFNVNAGAGCSWTASSGVSWITITAGSLGSGNGTVNYSVTPNAGSPRSGTITVSGQIYTINQAGITSRKAFDFDGDGRTDYAVFRPSVGEWWYLRSSDGGNRAFQFGISTDRIIPADYTGDGKTDVAFFRPFTNEWFVLRSENFTFYSAPFGAAGDIPAPADFDGDGKADFAVFRPSTAGWFINQSSGGTTILTFGANGDIPVVSDYDGDGKADIAVYRPSAGEWWYLRSSDGGNRAFQFGLFSDKPVPADYTGDGKTDIAFFRPSTGEWFVLRSENDSFYSAPFGSSGDIPVAGDYDGDGKTDIAVW
ncbi:MAG TPA: BACON domain-containing carbohydrate-binding protein, partial [Pyrinomonadaceae bacterium]|nr:BACON domain-containing carbohydrate-binding protein [Pyrinomonadaceae bacterium]